MNTIIFAYDDLDFALEFYVKCLKEEIKPIIGQKITMGRKLYYSARIQRGIEFSAVILLILSARLPRMKVLILSLQP